jgi:hypothetical protein
MKSQPWRRDWLRGAVERASGGPFPGLPRKLRKLHDIWMKFLFSQRRVKTMEFFVTTPGFKKLAPARVKARVARKNRP